MVAVKRCDSPSLHKAHPWAARVFYHCMGTPMPEDGGFETSEINPRLYEKLMAREEQPEASEERIIGEDKSSPELGGSLFTKESMNGLSISLYQPGRISIAPELQTKCLQILAETIDDPTACLREKREAAKTILEFQMRSID